MSFRRERPRSAPRQAAHGIARAHGKVSGRDAREAERAVHAAGRPKPTAEGAADGDRHVGIGHGREVFGKADEPFHTALRDLDDVGGNDLPIRADLTRAPAASRGRRIERLEGEPSLAHALEDELTSRVGGGERVTACRREMDLRIRDRRRGVRLQKPSAHRSGLVRDRDEQIDVRVVFRDGSAGEPRQPTERIERRDAELTLGDRVSAREGDSAVCGGHSLPLFVGESAVDERHHGGGDRATAALHEDRHGARAKNPDRNLRGPSRIDRA